MSAVPCYVSQAENKAAGRIEQRLANYEAARTLLANEFVNAFRAGAAAKVSTPGWSKPTASILDVLSDSFAGTSGDAALAEIVAIIGLAARAEPVQTRCIALIARIASEHAEFHADDLAEQIGGEA